MSKFAPVCYDELSFCQDAVCVRGHTQKTPFGVFTNFTKYRYSVTETGVAGLHLHSLHLVSQRKGFGLACSRSLLRFGVLTARTGFGLGCSLLTCSGGLSGCDLALGRCSLLRACVAWGRLVSNGESSCTPVHGCE